jgi:hypothetical protein
VLDGGLKERAHRWLRVTATTPIDEAFHLRHELNLLNALAEPGGIRLSAAAHEQVRDRLGPLTALSRQPGPRSGIPHVAPVQT